MTAERSSLSNFGRRRATKIIAFVLAVLMLVVAVMTTMQMLSLSQLNGNLLADPGNISQHSEAVRCIAALTVSVAAFLLLLLYLTLVAGREPDDDGLHLHGIDRLYTDINFFLFLCLAFVCIGGDISLWTAKGDYPLNPSLSGLLFLITALGSTFGLLLLLSLLRHLKNRSLIRHSLLGAICIRIARDISGGVSALLNGRPLVQRLCLMAAGVAIVFILLSALNPWFALLFTPFLIHWVHKKALVYTAIREGITALKEGDLEHQIPLRDGAFTATLKSGEGKREQRVIIKPNSELYSLAADINAIGDGLKLAVERELQSERMKSELISNVSHDLRTPLTSIITYIDLLKTEGTGSENAAGYIEIVEQKAARLKTLTDDLFEASKASSGSITVALEEVELVSLLSQGLGELDEQVNASGLDFRLMLPEGKIWVLADGRLLWRVIENLLSNIFKYAQPGSRVYIEPAVSDRWGHIVMKNISATPLNISPDELMERFTRGDEARSSEGSGLGLSIARSLTELQGGHFSLHIDGDLFKTRVILPLIPDSTA
ncbi:MAG: sensor histidine kinase [Syntrophomonadaceae bacterium]|nr:sensor histidine kinase [Syntrophomonadaceae bacterium]